MSSLEGKVAVVTGGMSGIGAATVRLLTENGAAVAVLDKSDTSPGSEIPNPGDPRMRYFQADISDVSCFPSIVRRISAELGTPTLLVNSAGIQRYGSVTETAEEEWDAVMAVNVKGAFLSCRAFILGMLEAGGGAIVNVASVQSFIAQKRVAAYATSKAALLGLTRSIAVDYAPTIRCNVVCPGSVDTPLFKAAIGSSAALLRECAQMHLLGRIARADEIANLILFLLSESASFITGQAYRIDGGLGVSAAGSPVSHDASESTND